MEIWKEIAKLVVLNGIWFFVGWSMAKWLHARKEMKTLGSLSMSDGYVRFTGALDPPEKRPTFGGGTEPPEWVGEVRALTLPTEEQLTSKLASLELRFAEHVRKTCERYQGRAQ